MSIFYVSVHVISSVRSVGAVGTLMSRFLATLFHVALHVTYPFIFPPAS